MDYKFGVRRVIDKKLPGFTLVELMISVFLIVSLGTIILSVYISTLRGTKKSTAITRVRENGNFAISQMKRNIQFAQIRSTTACSLAADEATSLASIDLTTSDGGNMTYSCIDTGTEIGNIASISGVNTSYLLDTKVTRFQEGTCSFKCIDNGTGVPKEVKIDFILEDVSSSEFAEDIVSIPFSTTVVLRNFSQ